MLTASTGGVTYFRRAMYPAHKSRRHPSTKTAIARRSGPSIVVVEIAVGTGRTPCRRAEYPTADLELGAIAALMAVVAGAVVIAEP
jgi:hypothetical protein